MFLFLVVFFLDGRVLAVRRTDTAAILLLLVFLDGSRRQVAVGVAVVNRIVVLSGERQIQILRAAFQRALLALFLFDYLAGVLFVDAGLRFPFAHSSSTT